MAAQIEKAGAVTVREGFGDREVTALGDLTGAAGAAAVAKEIEVRAIVAERRPRKPDTFREKFVGYAKHPDWAEHAIYDVKVGRKQNEQGQWEDVHARNFSIRAMETAVPLWGNLYIATYILFEDADRLLMRVVVYDAETNTGYSQDAMLSKIIERRDAKDRIVRGARMTSENRQVYLVEATKDEIRKAFGAERSKITRDLVQKLLPFHILIEARRIIEETNANENARDPEAAKKKVLDKFSGIGVTAEMLKEYLDRPLEALNPKDLAELGVLFNGLKEGDFTWADITRMKTAEPESPGAPADPKTSKLKEKLLEARAKAGKAKEPPAPAESEKTPEA